MCGLYYDIQFLYLSKYITVLSYHFKASIFFMDYKLLEQLSCKKGNNLLFRIGSCSVFFSEYNHMLLAIYYCLIHDIGFILSSQRSNIAFEKGWQDYFEPFCIEMNSKLDIVFNYRYNVKPWNLKTKLLEVFYKSWLKVNNINYITSDIFEIIRNIDVHEYVKIPGTNIKGSCIDCLRIINQTIYRLNPEIMKEITSRKKKLQLPSNYVGVHIRRGDKKTEIPDTLTDNYINKLEDITDIRDCFVATDDYRVITELKNKYTSWNFYTLTPEKNLGYSQKKYNNASRKTKYNNLLDLFTDIEISSNSKFFVGTLSSNIGMYLYLRLPKGRFIGIDYNEWRIW